MLFSRALLRANAMHIRHGRVYKGTTSKYYFAKGCLFDFEPPILFTCSRWAIPR